MLKLGLKDRPPLTICIGGCEVNWVYKVQTEDGKWIEMRIVELTEYNINGVLCPECQQKRDECFIKEISRTRITDKERVLRSLENKKGDI